MYLLDLHVIIHYRLHFLYINQAGLGVARDLVAWSPRFYQQTGDGVDLDTTAIHLTDVTWYTWVSEWVSEWVKEGASEYVSDRVCEGGSK